MIVYNWKAEFQDELKRIETCRTIINALSYIDIIKELKDVNTIAEMANALDRYEAILNEMEKEAANE